MLVPVIPHRREDLGLSRARRFGLFCFSWLVVTWLVSPPVFSGSTPATGTTSDQLVTQQGAGNPTSFGDFVSVPAGSGGLDSLYRYYIEVPEGLSCLVVEIFDADVGTSEDNDDAANERDRQRGASFNTSASYELFDPSGASAAAAQLFTTGDGSGPAGADNDWLVLFAGDSTGTFADQFGSTSYGNDDGTLSWAGSWAEFGDDGSAAGGSVEITGGELRVSDAVRGVTRSANLAAVGGCAARLTFDVDDVGNLEGNDCADVSVSADGGASWTVLEEFCNDIAGFSPSYDITSFTAADTRIRLRASSALGGGGEAFAFDNVQIEVAGGAPEPGHWWLEVDMSDGETTGDDVNAFGLRAHDGDATAGGTELNVYAESFVSVGINDNGGSRGYALYPYVTSGCEADVNNFDWDADNGGGAPPNPAPFGSWDLTSRSGSFTDDDGGSMSDDDAWQSDTFFGWTTDSIATDYGIWRLDVAIDAYGPANFGVVYLGDFGAADPAPTAQPEAGTFRIYLPADGGGAPVKPYLTQLLAHFSGPNPPGVGSTSRYTLTVQVVNPTAFDIDFSSVTSGSEVVEITVPGGDASFVGGSIATSQGGATESGGTVTWAPGTVAAGATEVVFFQVDVTPSVAGRIPVTGTPAAGGTTASFVDETCAAASPACAGSRLARATASLGPLCELAVSTFSTTPVLVSAFEAYEAEGAVVVEWQTAAEAETVRFDLYRQGPGGSVRVNRRPLPAQLEAPQGGVYRLVDPDAEPGREHTYFLVETEASGRIETHGPFVVEPERRDGGELPARGADFVRLLREPPESFVERRLAAAEASRRTADRKAAPGLEGGALKIAIREDGLYRVETDEIAEILGLSPAAARFNAASGRWNLTNRGRQVAWQSVGGGEAIEFYGQALDSLYTLDNVYRLTPERGLAFGRRTGRGPAPAAEPGSFRDTVRFERDARPVTLVALDPESDFWFWEGLLAGDPGLGRRSFELDVEGPAAGAEPARLTVHLQGASSEEHVLEVAWNGAVVGEARVPGIASAGVTLELDPARVAVGTNTVEVAAVSGGVVFVDAFELAYDRLYRASGGSLASRGDGNAVVTVDGFADPGIRVFDVSDPKRPSKLEGVTVGGAAGAYRASFAPRDAGAEYLAVDATGVRSPHRLSVDRPSSLLTGSLAVDYLVIAPAELLDAAEELAAYRAGRGLRTLAVDLEDVYDELNHGIAEPRAIRDFLAHAHRFWTAAPRFVVLAGAGTFDYKDNWGFGGNLIPPLMLSGDGSLFASDVPYGDVEGGDGLAEIAVGRLPVLTAAELRSYLDKVATYESQGGAGWRHRVTMVADNPDPAGDFDGDSVRLEDLLAPGYDVGRVHLAELGIDDARRRLLEDLESGTGLVSYLGHGGADRMASEGLLVNGDVAGLANADRPPVLTAISCHIALFAVPGFDALGELLVLRADGGAAAVWAPGWLSEHAEARVLADRLFRELPRNGEPALLGDVLLATLDGAASLGAPRTLLETYQLLGDPALELQLEPGEPAAGGGTGGGSVSGTVTRAATGEPVSYADVRVWDAAGTVTKSGHADLDGSYEIGGLSPGTYYASGVADGYRTELFGGRHCAADPPSGCDPTSGSPITVALDAEAAGIDFALDRLGTITGRVTDAASGAPVDARVTLWDAGGALVREVGTAYGAYALDVLAPGTYFVGVRGEPFAYAQEIHEGLVCTDDPCDPTSATPVAVDLDTTTSGIDFSLGRLATLSGRVTAEGGGPLAGVVVEAWDAAGAPAGESVTAADGSYTIPGLVQPGLYYVSTANDLDFTDEVYDGVVCAAGSASDFACDPTGGTAVEVSAPGVAGIDFVLGDASVFIDGFESGDASKWSNID